MGPESPTKEQLRKKAYYLANRDKILSYSQEYKDAHKERIRTRDLRRRISKKGLQFPTRDVPSLCECCGGPPVGNRVLAYDHDPNTGKFRGWLCLKCNIAIGQLGDTLAAINKAVAYLTRAEESHARETD